MSGNYYRPKITTEMQQRINNLSKHDRFHSHGAAKVDPRGHTVGSTGQPESFEQRQEREQNRNHVNSYNNSRIGIYGHRPGTRRTPLVGRDSVRPTTPPTSTSQPRIDKTNQSGPSSKPPMTFREPPTRGYNPYA